MPFLIYVLLLNVHTSLHFTFFVLPVHLESLSISVQREISHSVLKLFKILNILLYVVS